MCVLYNNPLRVCVCAGMRAYVYVRVCMCMQVCMRVYAGRRAGARVFVRMQVYMCALVCVYMRVSVGACGC